MRLVEVVENPRDELRADPAVFDAYLELIVAEDLDDEYEPGAEESPGGVPVWDAVPEVSELIRRSRVLCADIDRTFAAVLRDAEQDPVPWVGPDPTDDPGWIDPRRRTHAQVRAHRRSLAVRSAAADLAVGVHLSEHQVRARAYRADTLQERCPRVWAAYSAGDLPEQNAATAATLAAALPEHNPDCWDAFDTAILTPAHQLPPGKFRTRARATWERVHPDSATYRHVQALQDRNVQFSPERDGVTTISALVDAVKAKQIEERLHDHATHLRTLPDETRSLTQLRADTFTDLLTTPTRIGSGTGCSDGAGADATDGAGSGGNTTGRNDTVRHADTESDAGAAAATCEPAGNGTPACCAGGSRIITTVNLTIPALTLLGHSDEPAILDGYGPIDLEQARELAANAPQWIRVLTHPIDSTVLDVERRTYRFPTALRRWLGIRHPVCVFPGCQRPAKRCDTDHRTRWTDGGHTSADNAAPLCEHHHILKDETLWQLNRDPDTHTLTWTTPTGTTVNEDPPPF